MELFLFLIICLGILIGIPLFISWLFRQAGVPTYAHFPIALKWVFYVLWAYYSLIGIANAISLSQTDALLSHKHMFYDMPGISWSLILLFFPLHVMLVKFIRYKENPFIVLLAILSLIACWAQFLHATFYELFRDVSMKIGG